VRVVLEECWSEDAVRKVRSGEVDLAVIVDGPDVSGLHVAPYRQDRLAAVMRDDDALAARRRWSLPTCWSATWWAWKAAAP
jgi:DNA-binding transcriptional LysR family regulator